MFGDYSEDVANGKITDWKEFIIKCLDHFLLDIKIENDNLTSCYDVKLTEDSCLKQYYEQCNISEKLLNSINDMSDEEILKNVREKELQNHKIFEDSIKKYIEENNRLDLIKDNILKWNPQDSFSKEVRDYALKDIDNNYEDISWYKSYYDKLKIAEEEKSDSDKIKEFKKEAAETYEICKKQLNDRLATISKNETNLNNVLKDLGLK